MGAVDALNAHDEGPRREQSSTCRASHSLQRITVAASATGSLKGPDDPVCIPSAGSFSRDAGSARGARWRRRITSSWRRTTISTSFERRGRPNSHTNANRFPDNEIHKRPEQAASLDHDTSSDLASSTLRSRGRACEPLRDASQVDTFWIRTGCPKAWPSAQMREA
jgi:hypothetical protein